MTVHYFLFSSKCFIFGLPYPVEAEQMIKRQFYKVERGNRDDGSDTSSSSSDAEATEGESEAVADVQEVTESSSESSGYESEDSSAHEVDVDSSGLLINDEGSEFENFEGNLPASKSGAGKLDRESNTEVTKELVLADLEGCILKCKSVFKCRLCPRIVCLTEATMTAHLKSKRHARSAKLLKDGRLKFMLNSDGEVEEDVETHSERHARTVALAQDSAKRVKKNKGRQRQRKRLRRKKMEEKLNAGKNPRNSTSKQPKKKQKSEN